MAQDDSAVSTAAADGQSPKGRRARPTKPLPTDRIAFKKQLDILRAYAAASGPAGKSITNDEVGKITKLNASTVSIGNVFFVEMKLLQKSNGGHVPSPEVVAFNRAYEWAPDTASQKLAPAIQDAWFSKILLPRLGFRQMDESEAIAALADEAAAGPEYERQLRLVLDYMEAAGLMQRDGSIIRLTKAGAVPTEAPPERPAAAAAPEREATPAKAPITTAFMQPAEGKVQFHVSVIVDMSEFSTWEASRISAFFGGIAQVLAAKAAIEKGTTSG